MWGLQADFGPGCPWDEIAAVFPLWLQTRLTFNEAESWEYPKRVLCLPHRIKDTEIDEERIEQDTFLTQYLGEAVLEAVSVIVVSRERKDADYG